MKKFSVLVFMLCFTPLVLSACSSSEPKKEERVEQSTKETQEKSEKPNSDKISKKFNDMSGLDTTPNDDGPLF